MCTQSNCREMKFSLRVYAALSVVLSAAYFAYPFVVMKVLPVVALGILTYCEGNRYALYIAIGLLFSSFGDVFLDFDDENFIYFVCGLVNFLIAHLFYIAAYLSSSIDFKHWRGTGVIFIAFYGCLMGILLPSVDAFLIPAIIMYGIIITTMAFLAFNRYFTSQILAPSRQAALIGSLFFVVSDSVLSLSKFKYSIPGSDVIIMLTYYIGQTFIAMSAKDPFHVTTGDSSTDTTSPLLISSNAEATVESAR